MDGTDGGLDQTGGVNTLTLCSFGSCTSGALDGDGCRREGRGGNCGGSGCDLRVVIVKFQALLSLADRQEGYILSSCTCRLFPFFPADSSPWRKTKHGEDGEQGLIGLPEICPFTSPGQNDLIIGQRGE